jgi:hypothetical protein
MKSIKEKADEYAKAYLFSPVPQRAPNIHFVAGANYVLDVIQTYVIKEHFNLEHIIEQLKK